MSETEIEEAPRSYSGAFMAAMGVALLAAIDGLIWCAVLGSRLSTQQTELNDARQQNAALAAELRETDARLRVTTDELGKSLGLTQKQLDERAQEIIAREEADNRRLQNSQQQTAQHVIVVNSAPST